MKAGDGKKFALLFEAHFANLYKYVARRVADPQETERIVRLTFLDAVGQIQNTPTDTAYLVWLYSLAKPRVWSYLNKANFPKKQGLIDAEAVVAEKAEPFTDMTGQKVANMFKKLTMEEAEILRLKFFEELADGDVLFVLGGEEALIGPKIYRVLKRAHFLLFGESDQRQGVYFGELSGFLERAKGLEKIETPEAFRLSLKADLEAKQDRKEAAVESTFETPTNTPFEAPVFPDDFDNGSGKAPWEEIKPEVVAEKTEHVGSNDPAKIFVQAVKEMREDEAAGKATALDEFESREKLLEIFDKLKWLLILIPIILFVIIITVVVKGLLPDQKIQRFVASSSCETRAMFNGNLTAAEKIDISKNPVKEICANFEVKKMIVDKISDNEIKINVDVKGYVLEYKFAKENSKWLIKEYAKTSSGDTEQGKVSRDQGSL
jgi:DNA-directed RNA polymerase specialized sigma24 family protein